jgi:Fe2+ or Zn2+ uptake regulation protein
MAAEDLHRTADERLRRDGQRYTANRRALVDVLAGVGGPLSMAEVLAAAAGLAQSSAYRNLAVLEDAGVVHRLVAADDTARYELAEDLTGHHHHHLICSGCGAVTDIEVPAELEAAVGELADTVGRARGFTVDQHRLDLLGTCADCRRTGTAASA